jgi:hypothetical protein
MPAFGIPSRPAASASAAEAHPLYQQIVYSARMECDSRTANEHDLLLCKALLLLSDLFTHQLIVAYPFQTLYL